MKNKNILFVCDYAQSRSKYFAQAFQEKGFNAKYRGFSNEADYPLNNTIIDWSDIIIVLSKSWVFVDEYADWLRLAEFKGKDVRYCMIPDEPSIFDQNIKEVLGWLEEE